MPLPWFSNIFTAYDVMSALGLERLDRRDDQHVAGRALQLADQAHRAARVDAPSITPAKSLTGAVSSGRSVCAADTAAGERCDQDQASEEPLAPKV